MFYKVPFFTFFFLKKKSLHFGRKAHWLESEFYLKWISFNYMERQRKEQPEKGWQNDLKTNQQNMQRFLCVV